MTAELPRPATTPRRSRKAEAQQRDSTSGTGRRAPRLSYEDWVDGALALLAREGPAHCGYPACARRSGSPRAASTGISTTSDS
nr:hypothetical protein [Nocardia tengchongensis]